MTKSAVLLVFVLGLLIGYVMRPFTERLAAGNQSLPLSQATPTAATTQAPEATGTVEPDAVDSDVPESDAPQSNDADNQEEVASVPMLITPTPDRSSEIAAAILPNVRHFIGDKNAPVTLIEFSDFQ